MFRELLTGLARKYGDKNYSPTEVAKVAQAYSRLLIALDLNEADDGHPTTLNGVLESARIYRRDVPAELADKLIPYKSLDKIISQEEERTRRRKNGANLEPKAS